MMDRDDLRAAVGAGIVTEAQAASLASLADSRRGARTDLAVGDEPFELFKGFNEVFIVVNTNSFLSRTNHTGDTTGLPSFLTQATLAVRQPSPRNESSASASSLSAIELPLIIDTHRCQQRKMCPAQLATNYAANQPC